MVDVVEINAWFDRVPRMAVDVGHRRLPAFRSLGILGYQVALVSTVLVSLRSGLPLVTGLGLSAVAGMSFFAWGLLRRTLTGRETLVLVEYVWVGFGSVAAFLWASGGSIVAGIDAMAVSVCWFLAFGRLGCLTVGCCHGQPSAVGVAYGPDHLLPPRLTGRRLFPVALVEAVGLVAIGLVGFALVGGPIGRPTVWFLAAYAILRFGAEALRADRRPHVAGLSVPRLMCVAQGAAAIVAAEAWLVPGPAGRSLAVGAAALVTATVAGAGLVAVRGRNPLVDPAHLDETWDVLVDLVGSDRLGTEPLVAHTTAGMAVAVSRADEGLHVSLSHPDRDTFGVGVALRPLDVVERRGVTHLVMSGPPPAPDVDGVSPLDDQGLDDYFARPRAVTSA